MNCKHGHKHKCVICGLESEIESLKAITELKNEELQRLKMVISEYAPFSVETKELQNGTT